MKKYITILIILLFWYTFFLQLQAHAQDGETLECDGLKCPGVYELATTHQGIAGAFPSTSTGCTISDSFGADTSANYTNARSGTQGVTVTGGVATPYGASTDSWNYYNVASTGSDNHYVEGDVNYVTPGPNNGGLVLRCNGNGTSATGYFVYPSGGTQVILKSFSGSTATQRQTWNVSWESGQTKKVRVRANGSTFSLWVDGALIGSVTDATYSTGSYVGISFVANGGTATVDNFKGDTSSTCMD